MVQSVQSFLGLCWTWRSDGCQGCSGVTAALTTREDPEMSDGTSDDIEEHESPSTLRAFHLYTGDDGASHLERVAVLAAPGPTDPSGGLESIRARSDGFLVSVAGKDFRVVDHNVRRAQVVVVLQGKYRFSCPGGDSAVLEPGDMLFAEDREGTGHATTELTGHGRVFIAPFEDDGDAARMFDLRYRARGGEST
jgi:hypothetical protein